MQLAAFILVGETWETSIECTCKRQTPQAGWGTLQPWKWCLNNNDRSLSPTSAKLGLCPLSFDCVVPWIMGKCCSFVLSYVHIISCSSPADPMWVKGIHITWCCPVPWRDCLWHCCQHLGAMQPSAKCCTPWLQWTRAMFVILGRYPSAASTPGFGVWSLEETFQLWKLNVQSCTSLLVTNKTSMSATNNTEADWLTGVMVAKGFIMKSFRVRTSQRLAMPYCTTRL
jgi:hypothetical protein